MIDLCLVVGLTGLAVALVGGAVCINAARIPYLARLTGAAPLDKEDQC